MWQLALPHLANAAIDGCGSQVCLGERGIFLNLYGIRSNLLGSFPCQTCQHELEQGLSTTPPQERRIKRSGDLRKQQPCTRHTPCSCHHAVLCWTTQVLNSVLFRE